MLEVHQLKVSLALPVPNLYFMLWYSNSFLQTASPLGLVVSRASGLYSGKAHLQSMEFDVKGCHCTKC